jgi:hypothetical protein
MVNKYKGEMSREEGLKRIAKLTKRLGISPESVSVKNTRGTTQGVTLAFEVQGVSIQRTCESQASRDANFACLVLWLTDLVRNVERRIETLADALYWEGGRALPEQTGVYGKTSENLYHGDMNPPEAKERIERALGRLGLPTSNVYVSWGQEGKLARLRVRLNSGRIVDKISEKQDTAQQNLAALTLWLQSRAKNYERGIELELDRLFASNLLPSGT